MIIKLSFTTENKTFIRNYRSSILSFIKNSLVDKSMYSNNFMKAFTFSCYFPNAKITDVIEMQSNYFTLSISIEDNKLFVMLMNAFNSQMNKKFAIKNNTIELRHILIDNQTIIKDKAIFIKFLSPLLLREHNRITNKDNYLTYKDTIFNELLNENLKYMCKVFNKDYKQVKLTATNLSKTTVAEFEKWKYNCSFGIFLLECEDVELLNFLHKVGIGSKRSCGFGMFEIK